MRNEGWADSVVARPVLRDGLPEAGGGGGGASGHEESSGSVVELHRGFGREGVGVVVEGDGVDELLRSQLEGSAGKQDERDVAGRVSVVPGSGPGAESGAALAGKEAGIGSGFSQGASAGKKKHRRERR